MVIQKTSRLTVTGKSVPGLASVLDSEAQEFLADLQREFGPVREELLGLRLVRREARATLRFLPETAAVRDGDWRVADIPEPLLERKVEITGPTDAKMMINAL